MNSRWRTNAAPIIRQVLIDTKGSTEREIRRALTEAYCFGERDGWPYQAWLSEVRAQRGLPAAKTRRRREIEASEDLSGRLELT